MLVDSHCHLDYFTEAEIEDILCRAAEAGVGEMVTIGVRMAQAETVKSISQRFSQVWGTVGVHPQNVGEGPLPEVAEIVAAADHPKVIGIGESGLDYFYDKAPREVQQEGFRRHIRAARETGLPLVVHARDADEDIAAILRGEREDGPFDFLLHCFSSGRKLAEEAIEMGGYVSFSGILTFPKSQEIRDIARDMPADRLLVETDSPYLAPAPFRGKRNEPSYVPHTARVLAELHGMTPDAMAETTTANFRRLFRKAA
ncbi:LuxR family transcriptional regulator [Pseudoroseomonas rhizosphaerae]|uniref:LuxR family transcriptional regulator n=1 Tax=Teichococcus rhizosphaerae TaxID=1335062 RepID=A0A2C7AHC8_9PROT|nr:TatD family hydrolase [Pseudoroseomonas rhizosphaerae]PHK96616.1 LuxR family transcriptional regulator [Pseudoroseomonas rhizosphaerae]